MRKSGSEILWLAILLALILIMGSLLISGRILLFLAPRMVPMVWFGLAVLTALFAYQLFQILKAMRKKQWHGSMRLGMLLFCVPVVFILTVMPDGSTSSALPNHNVQMVSMAGESTGGNSDSNEAEISAQPDDGYGYSACVVEEERARFNSSVDLFSEYLHNTVDELLGKTITVYGFVYLDDSFPDNTILVSRLLITCCAADASIVGFHVKVEASNDLVQNEWVRVTGTVDSISLFYYDEMYDFPILTDGIILRCDEPDVEEAYLYP